MPLEITLSSLTSPTSSTLADIIHAQKLDPFCVKMTSLIKHSPNPKDPIHSHFALTTANELVWTAKQT
eukprot:62575-Rhodomonas_salina.1